MPKIIPYEGELEKVSYTFIVPKDKHPRSGLTGFEALDRMIRPVIKGISEKPMAFSGFEYLKVVRTDYKKPKDTTSE